MMTRICSRILPALLMLTLLACEPMEDVTVTVSSNDDAEPSAEKAVEFVKALKLSLSELNMAFPELKNRLKTQILDAFNISKKLQGREFCRAKTTFFNKNIG